MEFIQFVIDVLLHIDEFLADLIAQYGGWIYAILFIVIFCETGLVVTPFLPGDSLLFVAGALVSLDTNNLNVHLLVLILILAAVLGDTSNYLIGRHFGKWLFRDPDSRIFRRSYLDQTHAFYEKYGGKTIILARFVPVVRTFAPFVAGMGHMNYTHFFSFNVIGGVIWVASITYLGYFFGGIDLVQNNLKVLIVAIIFISILPAAIEVLREKRKSRKQKDHPGTKP